ncbi:hypothetical protein K4K51_003409 [Colletotrichum sp. SAR 10_75]|nr:hypothetical protein K4K51_003409 [Colletotrichum sp. SAR 10_75]
MHKHFIDSLIDIFSILGGVSWWDKQMEANKMTSKRPDSDAEQIEEMKGIIFSNKFALLDLSHGDSRTGDTKSQPPSEPESDAEEPAIESKTAKKRRLNGKKGKGKASKSSRKSRKPVRNSDANEATVENYRILEDDQLMSYTMAILSFRTEWAQIRHYVQDLWRDVAYRGLNTAIAGAVSNVAVAKIKKTELELFDDFPEHCFFEKITDTLTRGGLHRLQSFAEEKAAADPDHHACHLDMKEQLLMYTYQDLVDFCTDFQKSRNGKPTKAMRAKIGTWDPKLSLQSVTKEERIQWRRKYTINWLYDLVNEYSAGEQTQRRERCFSDDVDWSPSGPSGSRRTLLGLTDFAAFVTSLCLVDATAVQYALEPNEFVEHMNDNVGWHDDWLGQCGSLGDGIIGAIRAMDLLKPTKPSVARSAVEKDLSLAAYDKLETILEDLEIAKIDLWNDICGVRCRSAIDFTSVALSMIHIMDTVEDYLAPGKLNNQTFCKIYVPKRGKNPPIMDKNLRLIREAMIGKDEQILDTFIKNFEGEYCLSGTYMFWKENIQSPMIETGKKLGVEIPDWMGHCNVM